MRQYEIFESGTEFTRPVSYGVLCRERQDNVWVTVAAAAPLSADREAVERLAELCTALQLCPEQLLDVAADFISSLRFSGGS